MEKSLFVPSPPDFKGERVRVRGSSEFRNCRRPSPLPSPHRKKLRWGEGEEVL
jgi:hypothetical protein